MLTATLWVLFSHQVAVAAVVCPKIATVAIDVGGLDAETYTDLQMDDLYKSLLIRLLEEHVAVVARDRPADVVLRLARIGPKYLRLQLEWSVSVRSADIEIADHRLRDLHLTILHDCIELVRAMRAETTDCQRSTTPDLSVPARTVGGGVGSRRHKNAVAVGIFFIHNPSHNGLMTSLDYQVELAPRSHWRWMITALLLPPVDLPPNFRLFEWGAQTGVAFAVPFDEGWGLQSSLALGFDRQSYRFSPSMDPQQQGGRFDAMAVAKIDAGRTFSASWSMRASAGFLATRRGRAYDIDDVTRVRNPPLRMFTGITLSYLWN